MFGRFLIPLDGTALGEAALPLATALAAPVHGALKIIQVLDHSAEPATVAEAGRYLANVAAGLDRNGIEVQTEIRQGILADEILAEARQHGVDLVVMATHGRHGLERARLGSVTEQVLERSPVPVVVVRPGAEHPRLSGTLLVPVDGSPGATAALPVARTLARATAARVLLLQVITPLVRYGRGRYIEPDFETNERDAAETYLEELATGFRQVGVAAEARAVIGPISATILSVAAEAGADLIVMGTHSLTGLPRVLLGSVADEVVRQAKQPVLLVRCNDRGDEPSTDNRAQSAPANTTSGTTR